MAAAAEHKGLIDDLRQLGQWWPVCIKAADEIERLKLYIKDLQINSPAQAALDENERQAFLVSQYASENERLNSELNSLQAGNDTLGAEIAQLKMLLGRARTILGNMAREKPGVRIFDQWVISHEPLRVDAKNLLPEIEAKVGLWCDLHQTWQTECPCSQWHDNKNISAQQ